MGVTDFRELAGVEGPRRQLVGVGGKEPLVGGLFAAQAEAADLMLIEIDFTAHKPVLPGRIDHEGVAQKPDGALLIGEAQIDALTLERSLPVDDKARGKSAAGRSVGPLAGQRANGRRR